MQNFLKCLLCLNKDENKHFLTQTILVELGEPCETGANKIRIEGSECRNGTWFCKLEKVASKDNRKCETVTVQYNDTCENAVQC